MMAWLKYVGDILAGCIAWATIAAILPPLAAGLAIVWHLWRFYDRLKFGPNIKE